jgi:DNA-binding LacI/PurR family transcriptional regulator
MIHNEVDADAPIPKYYLVYTTILERIKSGELSPGSALPSAHELTETFGVSRTTITKAMDMLETARVIERQQGKGIFVLDKPAEAARASGVIALMNDMGRSDHGFKRQYLWTAIIEGIEAVVTGQNYRLQLIGSSALTHNEEYSVLNTLKQEISGLVFNPGAEFDARRFALLKGLTNANIPFVLVDRVYSDLEADCVLFNDEEIGYLLTSSLIRKGHKRIAFALTAEPHVSSVENRLRGYQRALEANNIPFDPALILDTYSRTFNFTSAQVEPINTHFELQEKIEKYHITAAFTANDLTTERVVFDLIRLNHDLLRERSLKVQPELEEYRQSSQEISLEIAMIGEAISPHYHSYVSIAAKQSGHDMGVTTAKLLIGRIKGTIIGPPQTVIIPMTVTEL